MPAKRPDPEPFAAMPDDVLICMSGVTLRVGGRWILPDTSWTIRRGQQWVVLGDNGSGKTSLTAALTGEVPVVAGRRWLNPNQIRASEVARISFETHQQLIARDEARDESRAFAGHPVQGQTVRAALENTIAPPLGRSSITARLGLDALLDQSIRSLSTGEMRRLLMARALLRAPRLLILDEPFDGLDAAMQRHLADVMTALVRDGLQIILVTHRHEDILPVMTHVLVLADDRVRYHGLLQQAVSEGIWPGKPGRIDTASRPPWAEDSHSAPSPNRPPILRMVDTSVVYNDRHVLKQIWIVSGPNGAGKSTLLQLICADHLQAYANEIYLFGRRRGSGESIWQIKQRIGLISNELQVRYRQRLSGYEVVLSGFFDSVGLFRLAGEDQRQEARDWIKQLAIEHLAGKPFQHMSNGQRRMILIARAMVKRPDLLILDEPSQGLDIRNRERVLALVDHIGTATQTDLIFTTHRADERPSCMTHELCLGPQGEWGCRRLGPL
jgi:molybdate transport system ATP-binding protein